jgi:hypothetical protein
MSLLFPWQFAQKVKIRTSGANQRPTANANFVVSSKPPRLDASARGAGTTRTGLISGSLRRLSGPQGLKPSILLAGSGTAEAVPCPNPFMRPVLVLVVVLVAGRGSQVPA